jgi:hypothetical protein
VLARTLAKDRTRRQATPGEVASDLAPFAAAAPQETVQLPAPRRGPFRRRGVLLGGLVLLAGAAAAGLTAWSRGRPRDEAKHGPPARVEPPAPALPAAPPDLLGPEQVLRLKRETRDSVVDWLRVNAVSSRIQADTARDIDKALAKYDGYQLTFGSRLLRSRKPTLLAARLGDLFLFELPPEDQPALELPPNRRGMVRLMKGSEARRAPPRVLLSGLQIDHADRLPRDQRVTGRVTFQALQPVGPDPHLRMVYYPSAGGAGRCIGMFYPKGGLPASGGEIRFDMPEAKEKYAPEDTLLVFFVELASLQDGAPVVESNTVAALVRPIRSAPRKRGP